MHFTDNLWNYYIVMIDVGIFTVKLLIDILSREDDSIHEVEFLWKVFLQVKAG